MSVKVSSEGELLVGGETLFAEYWMRQGTMSDSFDSEGFFKTGDIVELDGTPPSFKILGRISVDILKSGGNKISALEIENVILEHPSIKECSVIGLPDATYGQIVTAVVSLKMTPFNENDLIEFCRSQLASYKVPKKVIVLDTIPRNTMGKVNKKELIEYVL